MEGYVIRVIDEDGKPWYYTKNHTWSRDCTEGKLYLDKRVAYCVKSNNYEKTASDIWERAKIIKTSM